MSDSISVFSLSCPLEVVQRGKTKVSSTYGDRDGEPNDSCVQFEHHCTKLRAVIFLKTAIRVTITAVNVCMHSHIHPTTAAITFHWFSVFQFPQIGTLSNKFNVLFMLIHTSVG